jgi:hypothetical protein
MSVTLVRASAVSVETRPYARCSQGGSGGSTTAARGHDSRRKRSGRRKDRVQIRSRNVNPVRRVLERAAMQFLKHRRKVGKFDTGDAVCHVAGHHLHIVVDTQLNGTKDSCMVECRYPWVTSQGVETFGDERRAVLETRDRAPHGFDERVFRPRAFEQALSEHSKPGERNAHLRNVARKLRASRSFSRMVR